MVEPRHALVLLVGTVLLATTGGAEQPAPVERPLATLGSVVLRESDFERFTMAAFSAEQVARIRIQPDARQEAIDAWLDLRVQAAKARKDGIDQRATFQKALELMDMKLLVRSMIDRNRPRLTKPADVPAAEIAQYYHAHPERFQVPPGSGANGRQPLDEVRIEIAKQVARERNSRFHRTFLADLRAEMGFRQTNEAHPEASLLDTNAVPAETTIAFIDATPLTEADFRWFLKDAYRAEQRQQAFSQPSARRRMLADFLNMRLMAAKATKLGLDKTKPHRAALELAELRLLAEFLLERDGMTPWKVPGANEEERAKAFRRYLDRLRAEVDLTRIALP